MKLPPSPPAALLALTLCTLPLSSPAQSGNEGRIHSDLRREREELGPCTHFSFPNVASCAQVLFTGQPVHIAVGSLSPGNGVAAGLAFVEHKNFSNGWRTTLNSDAVATPNGSWRAGAYVKAFRLSGGAITPINGPGPAHTQPIFHDAPLINLYAQAISIDKTYFYGLGPDSQRASQTTFGLTETIAGANGIVPLGTGNTFFLYLELDARIPRLRPSAGHGVPSIKQLFNETTAPGLTSQPAFLEPVEALRIRHSVFARHLRLNYRLQFQNDLALGDSRYSFRRWTADLGHEFPFDRKSPIAAESLRNGPDSCTSDPNQHCPSPTSVARSLDHEGSFSVRLLLNGSRVAHNATVPFYLDPTLGGSDLNGQSLLASYPDSRFRAPNLILLRETLEHSIPRLPLGVYVSADHGKTPLRRGDLDFTQLRTTWSAGLTVHAGGLPVVYLLFAWGGNEGHHAQFRISDVLLGGSSRPSLF